MGLMDKLTKAVTGTSLNEALSRASSMNNADGTMNLEKMAESQDQMRQQLEKTKNSFLGKTFLGQDTMAKFQKVSEDAFQRQNVMMEMMNEHQKAKEAAVSAEEPTKGKADRK